MKISWLLTVALLCSQPGFAKLTYKVYTSSPDGFLVNSTLIMGEKEAILIDAQFTLSDAHRLTADILESKKKLTTIYITHQHPDHYFGLKVLKETFPGARIVARPEVIRGMKATSKGKLDYWKPIYGDNLTSSPVFPSPLEGDTLKVDGEALTVSAPVQGDDSDNSYVSVPSLNMVVAGDIVYSGVYPWTAETKKESRKDWLATLDKLASLKPAIVIPGHQDPKAKTDFSTLGFMKEYLNDFEKAVAESKTSEELKAKVKEKYPTLALEVILQIGADAAFPKKKIGE